MSGKRSVFVCHVEKIYVRTLGERRYVPGYPGVSQRASSFPHQRFPTLQPSPGQRKLSERKLEDQPTYCWINKLCCHHRNSVLSLKYFWFVNIASNACWCTIYPNFHDMISKRNWVTAELSSSDKWGISKCHTTVSGTFWLAARKQRRFIMRMQKIDHVDGRLPLLMLKNNLYHTSTKRNAVNRCAGTALHTHPHTHNTIHKPLNASCRAAQRHGLKRLRRTSVNNKTSREQERRNGDGGG